jgi:hypothetical protein
VAALTSDNNQLNRLTQIATRRLDRLAALPPGQRLRSLEDPLGYVHDTICLVLGGKRKARSRHLASPAAFFNFMQGVLQSCINSALNSVVAEGVHVPIGPDDSPDSRYVDPESPADVAREVALRETKQELVARLRLSFAGNPAMQEQIDLLDQSGVDRLPHGDLSAKQQHLFKRQAQHVLRAMTAREGVTQATGMEFSQS